MEWEERKEIHSNKISLKEFYIEQFELLVFGSIPSHKN